MESVSDRAHAKVNLTLEVVSKRPSGYHELVSVMQTVELHDAVTVSAADALELAEDAGIPASENLVMRAAEALLRATGVSRGATIELTKRIPAAAGMGGGSADAAATLRALNRLFGLDLSRAELAEIGAAVGSDVPFLVHEGAALVEGRGERVTPLPTLPIDSIVILAPEIQVPQKTASLFARLDPSMFTSGEISRELARRIEGGDEIDREALFNVFDEVAAEAFDAWAGFRRGFEDLGAAVVLSGAGPSMFALPPSRERGDKWHGELEGRGWRSFHTRFQARPAEDA